ncbi:MAG: P-loop ATPase, Sll1717 family [Stenotrophomonas acidaminiphila]
MESVDQIIWRNFSVGAPDAEADRDLLALCYVDNGALELIRDPENHASIVVGRTGQGKSAVLLRLLDIEKNAVEIKPLELAFRFVENSTVIRFFEDSGVNLNLFYRLLWRHVLVTEFLRKRFNLRDRTGLDRWIEGLEVKFKKDSPKVKAISYLRKWGENFWQETEVRLTEVTKKIEEELSVALEGSSALFKMKAGESARLTDSERAEVVSRGSAVVNRIQISDLNKMMQILAEEAFKDYQNIYFIAIDSLDEDWVSSESKLRLIRALIEEVRTFRGEMKNAKVLIALRQDLIEKVFEKTRDGGFQEEKYEIYYARVNWSREDLIELLARRVSEVFRRKYTGRAVGIDDVFPRVKGGESPYDYMLDRTLSRPRDVIAFANECFRTAADRNRVSWAAIFEAESAYSRKRKNALIDEWLNTLPSVKDALDVLQGMPETFSRSAIIEAKIESVATQLAVSERDDDLIRLCKKALEPKSSVTTAQILSAVLQVLYHVGAIGVKYSPESPYYWSYRDDPSLSQGDAKRVVSIKVHKMLWKALDIRTGNLYHGSLGSRKSGRAMN